MQVVAAAFAAEVNGFAANPEVFLLFAAHGHFIYLAAENAAQASLRPVKALVSGDRKAHFLGCLCRSLQHGGGIIGTAFGKIGIE